MSDSRAKVETVKAFQVVNRIVCRIHFAVDSDLYGEKGFGIGGKWYVKETQILLLSRSLGYLCKVVLPWKCPENPV